MQSIINNINQTLSDDTLYLIFKFLNAVDLSKANQVCKIWNRIIKHTSFDPSFRELAYELQENNFNGLKHLTTDKDEREKWKASFFNVPTKRDDIIRFVNKFNKIKEQTRHFPSWKDFSIKNELPLILGKEEDQDFISDVFFCNKGFTVSGLRLSSYFLIILIGISLFDLYSPETICAMGIMVALNAADSGRNDATKELIHKSLQECKAIAQAPLAERVSNGEFDNLALIFTITLSLFTYFAMMSKSNRMQREALQISLSSLEKKDDKDNGYRKSK